MVFSARKFSEGFVPFSYYNLKHRHSIFIILVILFLGFKSGCYVSDRSRFPALYPKADAPTEKIESEKKNSPTA